MYYATSAKTNEGINNFFNYLANTIYIKELEKKHYEIYKKFLEKTGKNLGEFLLNDNDENKKLKELIDELKYYKTEYHKLKKD